MSGYILSKKKSGQYAKAYAYEIHVSKSWYKRKLLMRMSLIPTQWT